MQRLVGGILDGAAADAPSAGASLTLLSGVKATAVEATTAKIVVTMVVVAEVEDAVRTLTSTVGSAAPIP